MLAVIDYGAGNLRSVVKAFECLGENVMVTSREEDVLSADRVVLPGNGAFGDCMGALRSLGLVSAVDRFLETGRPFLGICIGMQVLFNKSLEFGLHEGFRYIGGTVRRFPDVILKEGMKIPHTGWNTVDLLFSHKLFEGVEDGAYFYFVHSYYADAPDSPEIIASCDYGGRFAAAAARDNVMGVQFHPEKSQSNGLKLLSNFCAI